VTCRGLAAGARADGLASGADAGDELEAGTVALRSVFGPDHCEMTIPVNHRGYHRQRHSDRCHAFRVFEPVSVMSALLGKAELVDETGDGRSHERADPEDPMICPEPGDKRRPEATSGIH
jgi:hypothetical protein